MHGWDATRALIDHLGTPASRAVFEAQGFVWLRE